MAYTFLKAKGYEVGTSLLDEEKIFSIRKPQTAVLIMPYSTIAAVEAWELTQTK